jgi:hypothetical protein
MEYSRLLSLVDPLSRPRHSIWTQVFIAGEGQGEGKQLS